MSSPVLKTVRLSATVLALAGVLNLPGFGAAASVPAGTVAPRAAVSTVTPPPPVSTAKAAEAYGKLPPRFEPNRGQSDRRVKFISRGQGYTLFLTSDEAVLTLRGGAKRRRRGG